MKTIAIYNLKGGVGKTAAAVNIACLAARAGLRTLIWDLDPQGAASWYFSTKANKTHKASKLLKGKTVIGELVEKTAYEKLDIIPADFSYRKLDILLKQDEFLSHGFEDFISPFGETHSLVVLDCPPSLSALAEQVLRTADAVFVPLVPTYLSIRTFEQARSYIKDNKLGHKRLYPFFSMVDIRRQLHRELVKQPPEALKHLLPAIIPYSSVIEKMGQFRAPVTAFARSHPAAKAYENLYQQIMDVLE